MWSVFREFMRFLWRRDSDAMVCLIIVGSWWLTDKDTRQLADYFEADCMLRKVQAEERKLKQLGIPGVP